MVFSTLSYIVSLSLTKEACKAYLDGNLLGLILLLLWLVNNGLGALGDDGRSTFSLLGDLWLDSGSLVGGTIDLGSYLGIDMGGTRFSVSGGGLLLDLYYISKGHRHRYGRNDLRRVQP